MEFHYDSSKQRLLSLKLSQWSLEPLNDSDRYHYLSSLIDWEQRETVKYLTTSFSLRRDGVDDVAYTGLGRRGFAFLLVSNNFFW